MLDQKFWEEYFKVYDVLNIVVPYQELMTALENEFDLSHDDIVLDVGSGTGNLMIKINGKCKRAIGLDFSEAGINIKNGK
ncbi:MAG: class I SAM-dependent methyltransferase [Patescibacteria group bacterium]